MSGLRKHPFFLHGKRQNCEGPGVYIRKCNELFNGVLASGPLCIMFSVQKKKFSIENEISKFCDTERNFFVFP